MRRRNACRGAPSACSGSRSTAPARTLALDMKLPATLRPNSALSVPVRVAGLSAGEEARIVVAAVDVGILNLTNYKPPAPDDYYLGQRRLTAENPRHLWPADRRHAGRARADPLGRRRRRGIVRLAADAGAAGALFRHRDRRPRRHGAGEVRHPGLRRHRAGDGGGLEQGQGRQGLRRRGGARSGGADRDAAALPAHRRPRRGAARARQCRGRGRRLQPRGQRGRFGQDRRRQAADAETCRQAARPRLGAGLRRGLRDEHGQSECERAERLCARARLCARRAAGHANPHPPQRARARPRAKR